VKHDNSRTPPAHSGYPGVSSRLLDHGNPDTQWWASDALGSLGEPACEPLLKILDFPKVNVRIGAIEALGAIRSPRSVEPLIRKLKSDPDSEIRWVAALALGDIGDHRAVPALEEALHDSERYVRYGAVISLESFNWKPKDDSQDVYALIALQNWKAIRSFGPAAVEPLAQTFYRDQIPATRIQCVRLLGELGGDAAKIICESALKDRDPDIRWIAVLAAGNAGSTHRLFRSSLQTESGLPPAPSERQS
jgi:FOG: HEAT repeat